MSDDSAPWWSQTDVSDSLVVGQDQHALPLAAPGVEGDAPAVVAVVVVSSEPSEQFAESLESLAVQDYPNFQILVIYGGKSRSVAEKVRDVLPNAFIHQAAPGNYSRAANQALELVRGASFYMFCGDDVALDARCVTILVEELYRSNAGIVGPKLVDWNDPRRLRSIGMGSDRFGMPVDLVEPGEFDQEQYDAVRDVFFVPSGVQLVRADLFRTLEGFDPAISGHGQALDLCWRAHVVGARVVAVPSARVKHFSAVGSVGDEREIHSLALRHRFRTLLTTSSKLTLLRSVPLAVSLLLLESLYSIFTGQRRRAGDALRAISWNLGRINSLRQRRKTLRKSRQIPDSELRELQVPGSAAIASFFRERFGRSRIRRVGSLRQIFGGGEGRLAPDAVAMFAGLALVVAYGSRSLIAEGAPPIGQVPVLPSASDLLGEWLGGWRSSGLGGPGNAPTAYLFFGLVVLILGWSSRLVELLLLIVPIAIGAVGAAKLARPLGSARAAALAAIAYSANPLLLSTMSAARWDALIIWAGAPYMMNSLLRIVGIAPYGRRQGAIGEGVVWRHLPTRLIRWGLVISLIATFTPSVIVISFLMVLGVGFGCVLRFRRRAVGPLALAAAVAVTAPVALHAPFAYDVLRRFSWNWLVGPGSPETTTARLSDFVLFAPGGISPRILAFALFAAAAVGLSFAKGRRFDIGVFSWTLALVSWFVTWFAARGWIGFNMPAPDALLAPAAVGMALAVAVGARAVEEDLGGYRFGLRQILAVVGAFAMVVVGFGGIGSSFNGRWNYPSQSFANTTDRLSVQDVDSEQRVLWIGDPRVLVGDPYTSPGGVSYLLTASKAPDIRNRWIPGNYGLNDQVGSRIDLAVQGETVRLGRLLAIYGVDFVVVVPKLAPPPYEVPENAPNLDYGPEVDVALENQLDLRRVNGTPDLEVYRNEASLGPAVALGDASQALAVTAEAQLDVDLSSGSRLSLEPSAPNRWDGLSIAADGSVVFLALSSEGWEGGREGLNVESGFGGLLVADASEPGPFVVRHPTSGVRWFGLGLQGLAIGVGIALGRRKRSA